MAGKGMGVGGLALVVVGLLAIAALVDDDEFTDTRPPVGVDVTVKEKVGKYGEHPCWQLVVRDAGSKEYSPCVSKYRFDHVDKGAEILWTRDWDTER